LFSFIRNQLMYVTFGTDGVIPHGIQYTRTAFKYMTFRTS